MESIDTTDDNEIKCNDDSTDDDMNAEHSDTDVTTVVITHDYTVHPTMHYAKYEDSDTIMLLSVDHSDEYDDEVRAYGYLKPALLFVMLVSGFLSVYQLITVIYYNPYCLVCNPKFDVFGAQYFYIYGHEFYASDVMHVFLCVTVIVNTALYAIVYVIARQYLFRATLSYGMVMLALAILCLWYMRFYLIGGYILFVSILSLETFYVVLPMV